MKLSRQTVCIFGLFGPMVLYALYGGYLLLFVFPTNPDYADALGFLAQLIWLLTSALFALGLNIYDYRKSKSTS